MTKLLMPIVIIGAAVAGFVMFANPIYVEIQTLKEKSASYDEALNNSKALETERDKLTQKYNTINPENLSKLLKLLPENVDNIRLILEIEKLAAPYGMALKDVKYETIDETKTSGNSNTGGGTSPSARKDYGTWDLQFSTTGTYPNFLEFIKSLESNLRIVDIVSINFLSAEGEKRSTTEESKSNVPTYTYEFKIRTYWLKN